MLGSTVLVPENVRLTEDLHRDMVKVLKGDSLWSVAREHLGQGNAWNCLAIANPQVSDYTRLTIGTMLHLPGGNALQSCQRGTSIK